MLANQIKKILLFVVTSIHLVASAETISCSLSDEFMSYTDLAFKVSSASRLNETKNQNKYNEILTQFYKIYSPIYKSFGLTLKISSDWNADTVNAFANRLSSNTRAGVLSFYGGFYRLPQITNDGFLSIICHEAGHHLAGMPYIENYKSSIEGQADYYATSICLPLVLSQSNNKMALKNINMPLSIKMKCDKQWGLESERSAMCQRIIAAAESITSFLASRDLKKPKLHDKSKVVVDETNQRHPEPQCRLDTYVAGALCRKSSILKKDGEPNNCDYHSFKESKFIRPACWYHR